MESCTRSSLPESSCGCRRWIRSNGGLPQIRLWVNSKILLSISLGGSHKFRIREPLISNLAGCVGGGCVLGCEHDFRGCYVIGDSRLNFLRSLYLILPAPTQAWGGAHNLVPTVANVSVLRKPLNKFLNEELTLLVHCLY